MDDNIRQAIIHEERIRIVSSFEIYGIPIEYRFLILEAVDSVKWNMVDMDGCTGVADYWPNKFSPPCVFHDWAYITGRGGKVSDIIFRELSKFYGLPTYQANWRYIVVRIAWNVWFKWKHKFKGNVNPITKKMSNAYQFYLNIKKYS